MSDTKNKSRSFSEIKGYRFCLLNFLLIRSTNAGCFNEILGLYVIIVNTLLAAIKFKSDVAILVWFAIDHI